jgi:hypothetical protein
MHLHTMQSCRLVACQKCIPRVFKFICLYYFRARAKYTFTVAHEATKEALQKTLCHPVPLKGHASGTIPKFSPWENEAIISLRSQTVLETCHSIWKKGPVVTNICLSSILIPYNSNNGITAGMPFARPMWHVLLQHML